MKKVIFCNTISCKSVIKDNFFLYYFDVVFYTILFNDCESIQQFTAIFFKSQDHHITVYINLHLYVPDSFPLQDMNIRVKEIVMSVYERAVRNCPWSADLWLGYVKAMERNRCTHNKVLGRFSMTLWLGYFKAIERNRCEQNKVLGRLSVTP